MTTIDDVKRFNLKYFDESDGRLAPIEFHKDVPFEVKAPLIIVVSLDVPRTI